MLSGAVFAAFDSTGLMWDSKPATIEDIAKNLGVSFTDKNGDYVSLYKYYAAGLWEKGLMLGTNGVFYLENPITRVEGIFLVLRILGMESAAKSANLACPFEDVPTWGQANVAYAAVKGIVNGYSATEFGAKDMMTANQYLTFILRALGYSDKKGDFVWNRAAEKAFEIGLIGETCKEQYMRSNLFLRDDAAMITARATFDVKTKNGVYLADSLKFSKSLGDVPFATLAEKEGKEKEQKDAEELLANVSYYDGFSVPDYAYLDTAAEKNIITEESDKYFLAYSASKNLEEEYANLLTLAGFFPGVGV